MSKITAVGNNGLVIAIDGPAGAGKSTVARAVARRLGYLYIDTGAMYRAVTLKALRDHVDIGDAERLVVLARQTDVRLSSGPDGRQRVLLDGEDVTDAIRSPEVDVAVSRVAMIPGVREAMVTAQRRLAAGGGAVLDGRDTGTHVVPDADVKFFVTADTATRVARRTGQLRREGHAVSEAEVASQLAERDRLDYGRDVAPLRRAEGAIQIDTTDLEPEQVIETILAFCRGALG